MFTKIETNTGITMIERAFDVFEDNWDRQNTLIRIAAMQRVESLGGTYQKAAEWIVAKIEADHFRFA
jgi:hypothetical protein